MSPCQEFDAIVLGAGPAGSIAARLLDSWGHRVCLFGLGSNPVNLAESLPPSAATVLQLTGAADAVRQSAISASRGNISWWGTGEPRTESYPPDSPGTHIHRARFDQALRAGAQHLLADSPAASAERIASGFEVRSATAACRSAYLLDCTGRAGLMARKGYRLRRDPIRTIALSAVWTSTQPLPVDTAYTLVEAYHDGWAWAIPLSASEVYVGVLLDSQHTQRTSGAGLPAMYSREIDKTIAFRELLGNASFLDVSSCDASTYCASRYSDAGLFLVGDAASTVDPISSFGLKKALTSAWLAAVCIHTGLIDPSRASMASDYYHQQTRQAHEDLSRHAAQHFSVIAMRQPHPFWSSRAALVTSPLYEPSMLLAELQRLRETTDIALERTSHVRLGLRPTVSGNEVVADTAWITDALPPGMEFACGVHLMRLVEIADTSSQVPELYRAYNSIAEPVDMPNFLGALCLLLASGVLRHR